MLCKAHNISRVTTLLLVTMVVATSVSGIRLYRSRREAVGMLGEKEERIYLSGCVPETNTFRCQFAIDSSLSTEPSQCYASAMEVNSVFLAILETPAYISKLTILNTDLSYKAYPDALTKFQIIVNTDVCMKHTSDQMFSRQTFSCDQVGAYLYIKSTLEKIAMMSICDIEIIGIPLKLPTLLGRDMSLTIQSCMDSYSSQGDCNQLFDNSTSTCATAKEFFLLKLLGPSIINEIQVIGDKPFYVSFLMPDVNCAASVDAGANEVTFKCNVFAEFFRLQSVGGKSVKVCEIRVLGHESNARELPAYTYLGCYIEQPHDRDLPQMVSATKLTAEKCYKVCKRFGFKYFGLQNQRLCYCGFSYGKHGKAMDNFGCEKPCDGDGSLMCGNDRANSLFEIIS